MPRKYIHRVLLLYGLLNAALYTSLLPLWEGFDEEFHYSYVQYLGTHGRFPVLGKAGLSEEVNQSIGLLPMSFVMIDNLHLKGVRTFDQYFALDSQTRHQLYAQSRLIPHELRQQENTRYYENYEAHHAPLAYLLMAVPDLALSGVSLPVRVWLVRLLAAVACVFLMWHAGLALGHESGLEEAFGALLVFLVFSCQMFWAAIAHIANDWLAVPLAVLAVAWALRCHRAPSLRNASALALVLALGLLSKAYFLVFLPPYLVAGFVWYRRRKLDVRGIAALLAVPLLLAGPWYLRNLALYHNLSGRVEESSGVTTGSALHALLSIPWLHSLPFMARGAFWMGNSSFSDFSVRTMNLLLGLLVLALVLYCCYIARTRQFTTAIFLGTPVLLFAAAMIYVTGSSFSFTKGLATAASPWYLQAVMTPLLCLAMLGCQHAGTAGRWLAGASVILWGYILAATYVAKLFPLYGGFAGGRSTLREIAHWYTADWPRASDILSTTAMLPAVWLVMLLVLVLLSLLLAMALILQRLSRI